MLAGVGSRPFVALTSDTYNGGGDYSFTGVIPQSE